VQTETYAERFVALGAAPETVQVTGSVKFDQVNLDRGNPHTLELKRLFGLRDDETVLIAGSTQSPEDKYILDAYESLKDSCPSLRLIVVPRHQERFEEVAKLIGRRGFPLLRRSEIGQSRQAIRVAGDDRREAPANESCDLSRRPVILLDTLGELSACWGLADIAFVGGSFTNRGGQNMIEPAAYGAAVMFGPNTQNFRDVVHLLLAADAARVVPNGASLEPMIREYLDNPEQTMAQGRRARDVVLPQQGATSRTVETLLNLLLPSDLHTSKRREYTERAA
jgi:3-deoxy-D-manno-octulosonic-acid transferase